MYENYLAHYGVKGMKWGVRKKKDVVKDYLDYRDNLKAREKGQSVDEYRARRNRNLKIAAGVGGAVGITAGAFAYRHYKGTYGHNVVKKGAKIQRLVNPKLLDNGFSRSGMDFATYRNLDSATYPGVIRKASHKFQGRAKNSMRLANQYELGQAIVESIKDPATSRKYAAKMLKTADVASKWDMGDISKAERRALKAFINGGEPSKKALAGFGKLYNIRLGLDEYRNDKLGTAVKANLTRKGFKGIVDWNDVRNNLILAHTPMIAFDLKNNTTLHSISKIPATTKGKKLQTAFRAGQNAQMLLKDAVVNKYNIAMVGSLVAISELDNVSSYVDTKRYKKLKEKQHLEKG